MKKDIQKLLQEFEALYPDARPALEYSSPYELLVAVILSAQCTDERVNKVTRVLFEKYNTPQAMLCLSLRAKQCHRAVFCLLSCYFLFLETGLFCIDLSVQELTL